MSDLDNGNFKAGSSCFKDAVCIEADRIYDSCSDKDCLEDLQCFFTDEDQRIIDSSICVKPKACEIINVAIDVEPIAFNRGFFTVDLTFYFICKLLVTTPSAQRPVCVSCLCIACKKVILFGSESNTKTFTSDEFEDAPVVESDDCGTDVCDGAAPTAVCSVSSPIILNSRLVDESCCYCEKSLCIPEQIGRSFSGSFLSQTPQKVVYVSVGIFSIVSLIRKVQLLVPVYDFCIPSKECLSPTNDDPCEIFRKIKFPADDFFPPKLDECDDSLLDTRECGR